jgi:hypothetical protein
MPKNKEPRLKPKCVATVDGKRCTRDAVRGTNMCATCQIAADNEAAKKK